MNTYEDGHRGRLTRDRRYLTWKYYDNSDETRAYYAPKNATVYYRGERAQEYYKTDVMYWVEFGDFEFGVTEDEVEWEDSLEV